MKLEKHSRTSQTAGTVEEIWDLLRTLKKLRLNNCVGGHVIDVSIRPVKDGEQEG